MTIKFDKSLVLPWSDALGDEEPYEYPFLASYKQNEKSLTFIATQHCTTEDSKTFKLIRSTLNSNKFDGIIVEGISYSLGYSPKKIINWAKNQGGNKNYDGFETAYTIKLSNSMNIPFIGGEPEESHTYEKIIKQGYKQNDYLFYSFTQQIFQFKETKQLESVSIEEALDTYLTTIFKTLNFKKNLTVKDFYYWYKENNHKEFSIKTLLPEVCAPYVDGKLLTQRISSAICILRDQFLSSIIEENLNRYNNILVVYGGSHWSTQKEVLAKAFEVPTFYKV